MDEDYRELARGVGAADPEAVVALLGARLRAGERARAAPAHDVGGPLLAGVLRYLLESSGQREVEVLRASEVAPEHHGRWIRALRDLIAGAPRSWVWVERWSGLLGFDRELLALAAECRGQRQSLAPVRRGERAAACLECRHLRLDLTATRREERAFCGLPARAPLPLAERRIARPALHRCDALALREA